MRKTASARACACAGSVLAVACLAACALLSLAGPRAARAASWGGIEPLKSRRPDVERLLGKPLEEKPGQTGTLRFKVAGGTVTVGFVSGRMIETRGLNPELEGTVLQIVLQHESASDTPETLGLVSNGRFTREERGGMTVFNNPRDGLAYTFVSGRLRTSYYAASTEQLSRAQRAKAK
jgi:hypothetical protein